MVLGFGVLGFVILGFRGSELQGWEFSVSGSKGFGFKRVSFFEK